MKKRKTTTVGRIETYETGYASAIAVVLFLIVLLASVVQLRLFGREVTY